MRTGSLFTVTSSSPVIMWSQNSGWPPCLCTNRTHARTYIPKTVCVCWAGDYKYIILCRNIYPKSKTNMKEADMTNELFTTETLADSLWLGGLYFNFLNV